MCTYLIHNNVTYFLSKFVASGWGEPSGYGVGFGPEARISNTDATDVPLNACEVRSLQIRGSESLVVSH